MSEKKDVKQAEKPSFFARAKAFIVALPGRISGAFKNMAAELKKVAWPSKKDLINYSIVVIDEAQRIPNIGLMLKMLPNLIILLNNITLPSLWLMLLIPLTRVRIIRPLANLPKWFGI